MIKVDLITGFLGSGKTTFLKVYAKYLMNQGKQIGILENDYGAVNVDMMLLQDLAGENCELSMVAGGCDMDCHRRRFKTKLIAMGMSGYDRVIIEPSGIFDMDEFFDTLRESPLDRWYEIGNVITILDGTQDFNQDGFVQKVLSSQLAYAGQVLVSKVEQMSDKQQETVMDYLANTSKTLGCYRKLPDICIAKKFESYEKADFARIEKCGYQIADFIEKIQIEESDYSTVYFLNAGFTGDMLKERIPKLFETQEHGEVFRAKGFYQEGKSGWMEVNATATTYDERTLAEGQDVLIVIGRNLDKELLGVVLGATPV